VTERLTKLAEIISDLQLEAARRQDNESVLEIAMASRMLFRALPGAEEQCRAALHNMQDALALLIPSDDSVDPSAIDNLACSFCDKQRPEVMLGAGADDVFICNECVDLFTEVFRLQREKKENGATPS